MTIYPFTEEKACYVNVGPVRVGASLALLVSQGEGC